MIIRQNPTCIICGKPNAKAVYDTKSKIYGDSFLYWKIIDCDCKKKQVRTEIEKL